MKSFTRFSDVRLAGVALLSERANGDTGKRIEGVKRGVQDLGDLVRRCCFWAVLGALSACQTFEVGPFLKEQITGDTWRACLAREYQLQAKIAVRTGRNWDKASTLSAKGQAALDGQDIAPIFGKASCPCATAQARFDAAANNFDEARLACETGPQ
ncbi:MAG: hypothetical protein HOP13_01535 [Alphaproteobacteria bacterium]|nr:hypothetical protein [Alphaproteobacteria bacterium]